MESVIFEVIHIYPERDSIFECKPKLCPNEKNKYHVIMEKNGEELNKIISGYKHDVGTPEKLKKECINYIKEYYCDNVLAIFELENKTRKPVFYKTEIY